MDRCIVDFDGRIISEPTFRKTERGVSVVNFRVVACPHENPIRIGCAMFGPMVDKLERSSFEVGANVTFKATLATREFVNKDNVEVSTFQLVIDPNTFNYQLPPKATWAREIAG